MNDHLPFSLSYDNHFISESNNQVTDSFVDCQKINFSTPSEIYNAVFENSFHPVYIGNAEGFILKFNKKLCRLFGYLESDMISFQSRRFFNLYDNSFIDFVDERRRRGIAKAEISCIKKSGERFPCRISSVFYQSDKGEKRTMNTLVDISDNFASRWML